MYIYIAEEHGRLIHSFIHLFISFLPLTKYKYDNNIQKFIVH